MGPRSRKSSACGAQKAGTVDVSAGSLSHFRAEMQVSGFGVCFSSLWTSGRPKMAKPPKDENELLAQLKRHDVADIVGVVGPLGAWASQFPGGTQKLMF